MKKVFLLILAVVGITSFASCKANTNDLPNNTTAQASNVRLPNNGEVTDRNGVIGDNDDLVVDKSGKFQNSTTDMNKIGNTVNNAARNTGDMVNNAAHNAGDIVNHTADKIGKDNEESGRQVFRYIRLTELIQEILDMVDEKKIAFRPAVEISYLSEENQYVLLDVMQFSDITPSLAQAIHMKKLEQEGKLDTEKIEDLMSQEKPNQVEKLKFNAERFESVFPKNIKTNKEKEDFIYMCVEEHNQRERAKKRAMER